MCNCLLCRQGIDWASPSGTGQGTKTDEAFRSERMKYEVGRLRETYGEDNVKVLGSGGVRVSLQVELGQGGGRKKEGRSEMQNVLGGVAEEEEEGESAGKEQGSKQVAEWNSEELIQFIQTRSRKFRMTAGTVVAVSQSIEEKRIGGEDVLMMILDAEDIATDFSLTVKQAETVMNAFQYLQDSLWKEKEGEELTLLSAPSFLGGIPASKKSKKIAQTDTLKQAEASRNVPSIVKVAEEVDPAWVPKLRVTLTFHFPKVLIPGARTARKSRVCFLERMMVLVSPLLRNHLFTAFSLSHFTHTL